MSPRTCVGISILLAMFSAVSLAYGAEVYRWTDDKGTVHFTDDVSKIPEQYRDQTKMIEIPQEDVEESNGIGTPDEAAGRVDRYLDDIDRKLQRKKQLEKRVAELEEELKVCEDRLKDIEEYEREDYNYYVPFRNPQTGKFVAVGSPYYDEKVKLERRIQSIRSELEPLYEQLSLLKRSL